MNEKYFSFVNINFFYYSVVTDVHFQLWVVQLLTFEKKKFEYQ